MKIYEPGKEDNMIEDITLSEPGKLYGGSYFSKLSVNDSPLFVKIKNCSTKNGIIIGNKSIHKKIYADLTINQEQVHLLSWINNIEDNIKSKLYSKGDLWFYSSLDEDDIEQFFHPICKPYRNNYCIRVNLLEKNEVPECVIFNEDEEIKGYNEVKNRYFDCIIHIKGIRFTNNSFHVDIELKQVLLLNNDEISITKLDQCLLKSKPHSIQDEDIDGETHSNKILDSFSPQLLLTDYEKISDDLDNKSHVERPVIEEYIVQSNAIDKNNTVRIKEPIEVYKELYAKMCKKAQQSKQDYIQATRSAELIKQEYLRDYDNINTDESIQLNI